MKSEYNNPQNLSPEQFGGDEGFRLLTVEESAVLTDPLSARSEVGIKLVKYLCPELYSEGACRWISHNLTDNKRLSELLTYRTQAPELQTGFDFTMPPQPDEFEAACADFVESWNYLAAYHHVLMRGKGFWDGEESIIACLTEHAPGLIPIAIAAFDGQKIALVTSESSEKLEALRHGNPPDDKVPQFSGAEAEGSDELLRIMDHSHARKWNVAEALVAKMKMNTTRAAMHGKNF